MKEEILLKRMSYPQIQSKIFKSMSSIDILNYIEVNKLEMTSLMFKILREKIQQDNNTIFICKCGAIKYKESYLKEQKLHEFICFGCEEPSNEDTEKESDEDTEKESDIPYAFEDIEKKESTEEDNTEDLCEIDDEYIYNDPGLSKKEFFQCIDQERWDEIESSEIDDGYTYNEGGVTKKEYLDYIDSQRNYGGGGLYGYC